jgi:hypothetical protein
MLYMWQKPSLCSSPYLHEALRIPEQKGRKMHARRDGYEVDWSIALKDDRVVCHMVASYPVLEDSAELNATLNDEFEAFTIRIESILKGESSDKTSMPLFRPQSGDVMSGVQCHQCGGNLLLNGYCCNCKVFSLGEAGKA